MSLYQLKWQYKGTRFTAGIILKDDKVILAAPVLKFMSRDRWSIEQVKRWCEKKNYKMEKVVECSDAS